jgi:hypothetical protein
VGLYDGALSSRQQVAVADVLDDHAGAVREQNWVMVVPGAEQGVEPVVFPVSAEDLVLALVEAGLIDEQASGFTGNQPATHQHAHLVVL